MQDKRNGTPRHESVNGSPWQRMSAVTTPIFISRCHEDQLFCPLTVHVRITEGMVECLEAFNINKRIHRTTNPETWKVPKYPTHINTRLHFKFATNTPPNMLVVRKWSFTQRIGVAVSPCANPEGSHIDIGSDRLEIPPRCDRCYSIKPRCDEMALSRVTLPRLIINYCRLTSNTVNS